MPVPATPDGTTTLRVSPATVYFQCFPGNSGPDSFRGISGVDYVLKVGGVAQGSGTKTDATGKVEIPTAAVSQMKVGATATLEIFGTTYDLTLVALDAPTTVKGQQRRLSMLGYELGAVDGVVALKTDRASLNFQADLGLDPDGTIGNATIAQLTTTFGE
jgi:peptidoglycan hydrolase-like protein with peptidoglycan-binding domain